MDDEVLTVGIVGLGAHGTTHARVITELGHDLAGADAESDARAAFEERFDAPTYEHPADLFDADVDAVVVSTPTSLHEPVAIDAFEAGLDVLLEKPLAADVESAEAIAEAADRTGRICMVGFHHRFENLFRLLESYVDESYFGDLSHVDATFVRRRGIPGRGTWYTSADLAGGGVVMDSGSHALDMVLALFDWPEIEHVAATTRSEFGRREDYAHLYMYGDDGDARMYDVEDSATAFLEFADGRTASIDVAWAANAEAAHTYELRGTEAGAYVDVTNPADAVREGTRYEFQLNEVRSGPVDHYVDAEVTCEENDPYRAEQQAFLEAVRTGERPDRNSVHEALAVQRAVERIYEAAERSGRN